MTLAYTAVIGPGPSISPCVPWTDISQYVSKISTQRGASTELDDIQAGTLTLTLDDQSGFFTPGKTVSNNLLPPNIATCTDTLGTTAGFTPGLSGTVLVSSTSNPLSGTNCLKMTTPATLAIGSFLFSTDFVAVTAGQTVNLSGALRNTVTAGFPTLTLGLSVHFADVNRAPVGTAVEADITMVVGDGWHNLAWNAPVPTGAVWAQLVLVNRATMTSSGIPFCDNLSITQTTPYPTQTTNGVPLRLGITQGGNMLPYQLANVDHWNDVTTGDVESVGLWALAGAFRKGTNFSTTPTYNAAQGGLVFGHASASSGNGSIAYLVNDARSRITYLAPGTYTLSFQVTGIGFGTGAVMQTFVTPLNYANAKATPTASFSSSTITALTVGPQIVTVAVTVAQATAGLTGVEIALTLPMAASTVSTVAVNQFQLIPGTGPAPAFQSGDCYLPVFAGWVDTWITTTLSASGLSSVELDCTDQFRRLGNVTVGNVYQSMITNDPHVLNYWTFCDVASTTLTSIADSSLMPFPMSVVKATTSPAASFGLTAAAASILTAATCTITPPKQTGVLRPNFVRGGQTISTIPQAGTSFKWASGSTGNCGATSNQGQFPVTSRINAHMPAVGTAAQGSFDCWFVLTPAGSSLTTTSLIGSAGGSASVAQGFAVSFSVNPGVVLPSLAVKHNGAGFTSVFGTSTPFDGNPHHFALTWTITAGGSPTITWTPYLDGVAVSTAFSQAYSTQPTASNMIGANQATGGTVITNPWTGQISDVVLTDTATPNLGTRVSMGLGSYAVSEVGRLAMLMDVAAVDVFTDCMDTPVMADPWPSYSAGSGLTDAVKATTAEAGGRFYLGRVGNACYNNFFHMPKRIVFQDSLGTSVDDGLQFSIDGDHIINYVVIATTDGTMYSASNQACIDTRGSFPLTIAASYAATPEAQTIANWIVQYHGQPLVRVYGATFTCVNPTMTVQAVGLDVGSRVTLSELPDSSPAASMNWIVQSVAIAGELDGEVPTITVAVEMSPDLSAT